jgi:two-component system, OmpR family, response regulator
MTATDKDLTVLLISRDALQSRRIEQALEVGLRLQTVTTPEHGLQALRPANATVMLLDLRDSEETLFDWITKFKQAPPAPGLICITDAERLNDKLRALRCGADHVLTSPWMPDELSAMVDNLAQRFWASDPLAETPPSQDGVLQLDTRFRVLRGPQSEQALSRSEFLLLLAFAKAEQHQLEIWQIYEVLQKAEDDLPKQALEAQIYRLRKKIRDSGAGKQVLKAIRLQGYQLCNPIKIN